MKKQRSHNTRLASCGLTCLDSSLVFQLGFSAGLTVLCSEIPHERQAWERSAPCNYNPSSANRFNTKPSRFCNATPRLYNSPLLRLGSAFTAFQKSLLSSPEYLEIRARRRTARLPSALSRFVDLSFFASMLVVSISVGDGPNGNRADRWR